MKLYEQALEAVYPLNSFATLDQLILGSKFLNIPADYIYDWLRRKEKDHASWYSEEEGKPNSSQKGLCKKCGSGLVPPSLKQGKCDRRTNFAAAASRGEEHPSDLLLRDGRGPKSLKYAESLLRENPQLQPLSDLKSSDAEDSDVEFLCQTTRQPKIIDDIDLTMDVELDLSCEASQDVTFGTKHTSPDIPKKDSLKRKREGTAKEKQDPEIKTRPFYQLGQGETEDDEVALELSDSVKVYFETLAENYKPKWLQSVQDIIEPSRNALEEKYAYCDHLKKGFMVKEESLKLAEAYSEDGSLSNLSWTPAMKFEKNDLNAYSDSLEENPTPITFGIDKDFLLGYSGKNADATKKIATFNKPRSHCKSFDRRKKGELCSKPQAFYHKACNLQ